MLLKGEDMEASEINILQIILDSGIVVKLVLIILILMSVVSWAVIFLKRRAIGNLKSNNVQFENFYRQSGNLREVVEICENLPFSPSKTIFMVGHEELEKIRCSSMGRLEGEELQAYFERYGLRAIERAIQKGFNEANVQMEKYLSLLASIGSVAPFVGLFGTVWGIIDSFTGLASGGATLDAVAPGIAEALVATAVGLAAAIPAVWFYNHYNNVNGEINLAMDSFKQDFINNVGRSFT